LTNKKQPLIVAIYTHNFIEQKKFFNTLKKNQPAANVDQQSTIKSTPESTLCVELSDEELCAVNGGEQTIDGEFITLRIRFILNDDDIV
jgi:hypothetical protein